jgi:hypothetical protein
MPHRLFGTPDLSPPDTRFLPVTSGYAPTSNKKAPKRMTEIAGYLFWRRLCFS